MPAVSWNQFRPSRLKSCWTTNGGQDLKSNCTTESYDGGDPSSAADLKTSIVDRDGNLREGLCHDGDLKTSLTGVPTVPKFVPTDISGLSLWLDADASYLLTEPSARQFTAANSEYFRSTDATLGDPSGGSFWYSCWVYIDSYKSYGSVVCGHWGDASADQSGLIYFGNTGNLQYYCRTVDGIQAANGSTLSTGQWYHQFLFWDDAANTIYGASDNENFVSAGRSGYMRDTGEFNIGMNGLGLNQPMDGRIAAVAYGKNPTDSRSAIRDYFYNNGIPRKAGEITAAKQTSTGLVEFWPLNEYDGNALGYFNGLDLTDNNTVTSAIGPGTDKIADESSNANHGTITGFTNTGDIVSTDVPSALAGSLDYSMKGDGTGYVTLGTGLSPTITGSLTHSFWFNADSLTGGDEASSYYLFTPEGLQNQLLLRIHVKTDSSVEGYTYDGSSHTFGNTAVSLGVWYHGVLTYNSSTGLHTLYIDGSSAGTITKTPATIGGGKNSILYREDSPAGEFKGKLADVRLYDYELTADEVTYLYTAGASGTAPATGPVGQWGGSNESFPLGAVVDGQPVIRATDRSADGVDAASTTLSKRPIYVANVANGKGGLLFDATDDLMDLVSTLGYTDFTCFAVVQLASDVTTATARKDLFGAVDQGNGAGAWTGFGGMSGAVSNERFMLGSYAYTGSAKGVGVNDGDITAGVRLVTGKLSGTTETVRIDGVERGLTTSSSGGLDASDAESRWNQVNRIGNLYNGVSYFDDHILAVLIYDSALSDDDMASVESYLSDQYGLGL